MHCASGLSGGAWECASLSATSFLYIACFVVRFGWKKGMDTENLEQQCRLSACRSRHTGRIANNPSICNRETCSDFGPALYSLQIRPIASSVTNDPTATHDRHLRRYECTIVASWPSRRDLLRNSAPACELLNIVCKLNLRPGLLASSRPAE